MLSQTGFYKEHELLLCMLSRASPSLIHIFYLHLLYHTVKWYENTLFFAIKSDSLLVEIKSFLARNVICNYILRSFLFISMSVQLTRYGGKWQPLMHYLKISLFFFFFFTFNHHKLFQFWCGTKACGYTEALSAADFTAICWHVLNESCLVKYYHWVTESCPSCKINTSLMITFGQLDQIRMYCHEPWAA